MVEENKTRIESADGRSKLTLYEITADEAGKYAVAVENALGTDCQFASVAVEGDINLLISLYILNYLLSIVSNYLKIS